jgi:hypothetical protein
MLQGDAFHGQDETCTSLNKGAYKEMVDWYKYKVEIVKEAYEKGVKIVRCYLSIYIYIRTLQKLMQIKSLLSLWMRFEVENSWCLLMDLEMYHKGSDDGDSKVSSCIFLPRFLSLFVQLY